MEGSIALINRLSRERIGSEEKNKLNIERIGNEEKNKPWVTRVYQVREEGGNCKGENGLNSYQ